LHAVRDFAQPPQGAYFSRSGRPRRGRLFRIVGGESYTQVFITDSIRWLSTMGVSSRCKATANWVLTCINAYATPATENPAADSYEIFISRQA